MRRTSPFDLPRWPAKGQRRILEQQWIEALERYGLPAELLEPPLETPRALFKAVDEFNGGLFWECHETLEDVWRETPYPLRFFYHAIIKAAVGLHHARRRNLHGARVKLSDSARLLPLFQPAFMGVRTDRLLEDVSAWLARVERDDVDWDGIDALTPPRIELT
ncbi:MAG: DUF309 domain-containing protein [Chloroflexi bacterium]|nr:DUF309 domain-containing protein [Chloroflexota bacterium]